MAHGIVIGNTGLALQPRPRAAEPTLNLPFSTLEHNRDPVLLLTPVADNNDPTIVYVNEAFEQLTGYNRTRALGASPRLLIGSRGQFGWLGRLRRRMQSHMTFSERCRLRCANEDALAVLVEAHPVSNNEGKVAYWLVKMHNLAGWSERPTRPSQVVPALHDDLTGLLNRAGFEQHVSAALRGATEQDQHHVLCYLDLDQFKVINDTCGHEAGDELLRRLGELLPGCLRDNDTLARLGGDEFGVLFQDATLTHAQVMADRLREAIEKFRFPWLNKVFSIGVSIGLVCIDTSSKGVSQILSAADTACFAAKDLGRNRIHVHHHEDGEIARRHGEMEWVTQIQAALDHGRLQLHLQEIQGLSAAASDGGRHYEVLLRMEDEDGSLISPEHFLPAAENYHLSTRIDNWVVGRAFDHLTETEVHRDDGQLCCINLSGHTMTDAGFLQSVVTRLRTAPHAASSICFEITETAVIANLGLATHFITSLKKLGCRFALDDFGSGLSSFAYLKNLPVDLLKIDGMFVRNITRDPIDLAFVRSINEIGHVMGKLTVAEFVEDSNTLQILRQLGVDYAQGFHISRPAPLV
ncbi:MAG: EAL domain-containing protein [Gammaproteobacteria bacterium]|nr:EAL domain-containing protein [Gammaproteobacteria bacterium]NND61428.1 EAL domain-containing protein [Gammaproteobacteria bacterium]